VIRQGARRPRSPIRRRAVFRSVTRWGIITPRTWRIASRSEDLHAPASPRSNGQRRLLAGPCRLPCFFIIPNGFLYYNSIDLRRVPVVLSRATSSSPRRWYRACGRRPPAGRVNRQLGAMWPTRRSRTDGWRPATAYSMATKAGHARAATTSPCTGGIRHSCQRCGSGWVVVYAVVRSGFCPQAYIVGRP